MTTGSKYVKIIEWSDTDNCFIGAVLNFFMADAMEMMSGKYLMSYAKSLKKWSSFTRRMVKHFHLLYQGKSSLIKYKKLPDSM